MDRKTFNRKLSGVVKSAKTMRDNVQELIVAGLVHFEEHQDTGYLTDLVRACQGVRSLPTTTISEYIKLHANVGWGKLKDGKPGFKKTGKDIEVTMPKVTWYDWEGGDHNKVKRDYQFLNSIKTAIQSGVTAYNEGRLPDEQLEELKKELKWREIEYTIDEDAGNMELI